MSQKVRSLLQQRKALENDLNDEREELSYLERTTSIFESVPRARRRELERSIKELNKWIESIDFTIAEIQWEEGVQVC